jgi:hypothetical protein
MKKSIAQGVRAQDVVELSGLELEAIDGGDTTGEVAGEHFMKGFTGGMASRGHAPQGKLEEEGEEIVDPIKY